MLTIMSNFWTCPICGGAVSAGAACPKCGVEDPKLSLNNEEIVESSPRTHKVNETVITGIRIPFSHLLVLLIKLSIAAVPAAIIVAILWTVVVSGILGTLGAGK